MSEQNVNIVRGMKRLAGGMFQESSARWIQRLSGLRRRTLFTPKEIRTSVRPPYWKGYSRRSRVSGKGLEFLQSRFSTQAPRLWAADITMVLICNEAKSRFSPESGN